MDLQNTIVIKLYWIFFLVYHIRLAKSKCGCKSILPLLLNGHYVMWPTSKVEEKYINDKQFIPQNIIYTRFQISSSNRVFLAAPRYKNGVPFTLGYADLTNKDKCYNYVRPFPCLDKQDLGTCDGDSGSLVNAVDLVMGQNGVLWVLDIGISNTLCDQPSRNSDPKIVGFDSITGNPVHIISMRTLTYRIRSRLQHLAVEHVKNTTTLLYLGDGGTQSIIVWCVERNKGHRVKLSLPSEKGRANVPQNDIFYMALVEHEADNYIYFTYLCSDDIFRTTTKDLQNRKIPKSIVNLGKKMSKMQFLGVGYGSILYFRMKGQNDMYAWDTTQSFLEENVMMVRKSKDCRTITHVNVDEDCMLWILESNIQDFIINHVGRIGPTMILSPVIGPPPAITNSYNCDRSDDPCYCSCNHSATFRSS